MIPKEKNILLVDSDQDMCWLMRTILRDINCHIRSSQSLGKTMELIAEENFDLMLLDMPLTNFSGIKTIEAVLSKNPRIPIIVILSMRNDNLLKRLNELGICNFIDKPFVTDYLVDRVKETLRVEH